MKIVVLLCTALVLFACAKKKEGVGIEPPASAIAQDFSKYELAYKDAIEQYKNGKPNKALETIEAALKEVEDKAGKRILLSDDSANVYRSFRNLIEEAIYRQFVHGESKQEVQDFPESVFWLYLMRGVTFVELKRYDEAKVALLKTLELNPVYTGTLFELGVISQEKKDWKEFLRLTQEAHKVSYTQEDLARCYRNYGYYFIEQQKYDDAIAMYYASLAFDSKQFEKVSSQLLYIHQQTQQPISQPTEEQISAAIMKNNITFGADANIVEFIYALGEMFEEMKAYEKAKYCFKVLYNLTELEQMKKRIEKMP